MGEGVVGEAEGEQDEEGNVTIPKLVVPCVVCDGAVARQSNPHVKM